MYGFKTYDEYLENSKKYKGKFFTREEYEANLEKKIYHGKLYHLRDYMYRKMKTEISDNPLVILAIYDAVRPIIGLKDKEVIYKDYEVDCAITALKDVKIQLRNLLIEQKERPSEEVDAKIIKLEEKKKALLEFITESED